MAKARRIRVEDIRPGHKIATKIQELLDGSLRVLKSQLVEKIEECPGMWRTHIHVNRMDCYDSRCYVYVVDE